jgi:hypothetical protein
MNNFNNVAFSYRYRNQKRIEASPPNYTTSCFPCYVPKFLCPLVVVFCGSTGRRKAPQREVEFGEQHIQSDDGEEIGVIRQGVEEVLLSHRHSNRESRVI